MPAVPRSVRGASTARSAVRVWRPTGLDGAEVLHEEGGTALRRFYFDAYVFTAAVGVDTDVRYRGQHYAFVTGVVHLGEPGEVYATVRQRRPCAVRVLQLEPHVVEGAARALGIRGPVHFRLCAGASLAADPATYAAHRLLHQVLASDARASDAPARPADDAGGLARQTLLADALGRVLTASAERRPAAPRADAPAVACARALLHARWAEPVSLDELARAAGRHPVHLAQAFRRTLGLPPHQYQLHLRLARARRLLAGGAAPSRTALACGFADQAHLTRHFGRAFGLTPGAYARAVGR